jgi:hypothetical protein
MDATLLILLFLFMIAIIFVVTYTFIFYTVSPQVYTALLQESTNSSPGPASTSASFAPAPEYTRYYTPNAFGPSVYSPYQALLLSSRTVPLKDTVWIAP